MELEQSTLVDWIKGSVRSSEQAREFNKKHQIKAEGHIDQNIVNITIRIKTIVLIL